jgi:hypothetical protein
MEVHMSFFGDIGKAIGGVARGAAGAVGGVLGGAAGIVGDVLDGPTKLIGRLGTNMLPAITLKHNVHVDGKIDVAVNATVKVEIPDLVRAAEMIKDGLIGFDIFGGALHELVSNLRERDELRNLLRHLAILVHPIDRNPAGDLYYLEMTLLNKTASLLNDNPGLVRGRYKTTAPAGCRATVSINGISIIESMLLKVPDSDSLTQSQIRDGRSFVVTHLNQGIAGKGGSGRNDIIIDIDDPAGKGSAGKSLQNAKLQIRLFRSERFGRSTVFEYIIDGNQQSRHAEIQFFIDDPDFTPAPHQSARTQALRAKIEALVAASRIPNIPSDFKSSSPGTSTSVDLVQSTILAAVQERHLAADDVESALSELDDTDPNTFDVRTPFFCSIHAAGGSVTIKDVQVAAQLQTGPQAASCVSATTLLSGDELAVRLPIRAGVGIARNEIQNQVIFVTLSNLNKSAADGGCTATVTAGFEWASRVLGEKSAIDAKGGAEQDLTFGFSLSDVLA